MIFSEQTLRVYPGKTGFHFLRIMLRASPQADYGHRLRNRSPQGPSQGRRFGAKRGLNVALFGALFAAFRLKTAS
jgi:hypothetical protein